MHAARTTSQHATAACSEQDQFMCVIAGKCMAPKVKVTAPQSLPEEPLGALHSLGDYWISSPITHLYPPNKRVINKKYDLNFEHELTFR